MSPPLPILPGWWEDLEQRYARPKRAYHTIEHVRAVLAHWEEVHAEGRWRQPGETWVAVLLHDVIYEPGARDNEERSALLVPSWTARFEVQVDVGTVQALIRATASHGHNQASGDLALFLDCDMAILGAPPDAYDRYLHDVRQEYAGRVSDEDWRQGRKAFLEALIGKPVFQSARFHERYGDQAQRNLTRELATLC